MFNKNIGKMDRIIRFVLGVGFLLVGIFFSSGILKVLLIILGIIGVFTSITGFCGIYKLFGISTLKK